MSKVCRLLFIVDEKVIEKEYLIIIYVKNVMLYEVYVEF